MNKSKLHKVTRLVYMMLMSLFLFTCFILLLFLFGALIQITALVVYYLWPLIIAFAIFCVYKDYKDNWRTLNSMKH